MKSRQKEQCNPHIIEKHIIYLYKKLLFIDITNHLTNAISNKDKDCQFQRIEKNSMDMFVYNAMFQLYLCFIELNDTNQE